MNLKAKHAGIVKGGRFLPSNPEVFKKAFWHHEGKEVELIVSRKRRSRSTKENAYYWAVVVLILADYLGYTSDEMNDALKWKFLRREGKKVDTVGSFKDLDTSQFEEKMSEIRQWASIDLSVYIPLPNEIDY